MEENNFSKNDSNNALHDETKSRILKINKKNLIVFITSFLFLLALIVTCVLLIVYLPPK